MEKLVVVGRQRKPLFPLNNIAVMEIFVEPAKFINIVLGQCVPQPIDTEVVTHMVSHGQKGIVDPLFQVCR